MKITVDESVCLKHDIALEKVLVGLLFKLNIDVYNVIDTLFTEQELEEGKNGNIKLDKVFSDKITQVLLASDTAVPDVERCEKLVIQLRALYPKGNNEAGYPWRGNLKDLTKRMQKFFKIYGNYSDEDIIDATEKYIKHFNGNTTFMRTLKYFILKSDSGEENSDLATWLENREDIDEDSTTWLTDIR